MRRVVVTAVSVISPLGRGWGAFTEALKAGKSAGRVVSLFDASAFPTRVAAEVLGFDAEDPFKEAQARGLVLGFEGQPLLDRTPARRFAVSLG